MPTKLNRDLFTEEGWKIVNDLSLRHDIFRPFFSPGPLFQKGFDKLKPGDIIHGPDLKWTTNEYTLYKITKEYEFVGVNKKENKATKKDITIRGWSLFKYKGEFYSTALSHQKIVKISIWFTKKAIKIIQSKINWWEERNVINPDKYTDLEKKDQNWINYMSYHKIE